MNIPASVTRWFPWIGFAMGAVSAVLARPESALYWPTIAAGGAGLAMSAWVLLRRS